MKKTKKKTVDDVMMPIPYMEFVMEQMGFSQADLVRFELGHKSHI